MRTFWTIPFSDLIVILGIIITIGLAVIILWAELTIKRRWDTLYLPNRKYLSFYRKLLKWPEDRINVFPYGSRCSVNIIKRKGNLAAGRIASPPKEQESLPHDTMVLFDYRHAVPVPEEKGPEEKGTVVIIPSSAILAKLEYPEQDFNI